MRRIVLSGFFLVAAAACAPPAVEHDGGGAAGIDPESAQGWALDDHVVTQDEYRAAVTGFISCMAAAGYQSTEPVVSPVDGITLLYDITPEGDPKIWNEKIETCNLLHLSHIEPAYLESRQQIMDESLREATITCLDNQGIGMTGRERVVADFAAAAGERTQTVMECVTDSARKLFPELPDELTIRW